MLQMLPSNAKGGVVVDDEALARSTMVRRHHPRLLSEAQGNAAPKAFVAFASATLAAGFLGIIDGFALGSSATMAVVVWFYSVEVRRIRAKELLSRVEELSPGRAGIVLRETAGDAAQLRGRVFRDGVS